MKGSLRKIKNFFGFNRLAIELNPGREKETIEKIANHIIEFVLEFPVEPI